MKQKRLTKQFAFKVSERLHEEIRSRAIQMRLNESEFIRLAVVRALPAMTHPPKTNELVF